jgi:hypothetical protein
MQSVLHGMKAKLAQVQEDISQQLQQYEHLVNLRDASTPPKPEGSAQNQQSRELSENGAADQPAERALQRRLGMTLKAPEVTLLDTIGHPARGEHELSTYFEKQEKGHDSEVTRSAAEAEALGY